MAARDIFALHNSLGGRLIRLLYGLALILIVLMVILGLVRGISLMSRQPMPRPAMTGDTTSTAPAPGTSAAQAQPQPGMQPRRFGGGRMMMDRRFGPRRPMPFGLGRNPVAAGFWIILGTLLRGAIMLMVVRILAELGLAVLAMPRRSEI